MSSAGGHDGFVLPRILAAVAAVWCACYLVGYLRVVRAQSDDPAWWYVALVGVAVLSGVGAAIGIAVRPALVGGLIASALATVLGLFTIGGWLGPAVAANALGLVIGSRSRRRVVPRR